MSGHRPSLPGSPVGHPVRPNRRTTPVTPAPGRPTACQAVVPADESEKRSRILRLFTLLTLVAALSTTGCLWSPDAWRDDADREVGALLGEVSARELGNRDAWVEQPEVLAPPDDADADTESAGDDAGDDASEAPPTRRIDLAEALALAVGQGREFLTRREQVYLEGLDLTLTRFAFGPILDATIAYLWSDSETGLSDWSLAPAFSASQILDSGGSMSFTAAASAGRATGSKRSFDTSVDMTFTQPLMRGAGYEVSHDALTQAEQDVVYEVRAFELFREDFAIGIAQDFFDILSQRQRLTIREASYQQALFDRERSEALRRVDRNKDEDVFLARRREVSEENDLLVARANLERSLDDFKVRLGLDVSVAIELVDMEPPFESVRLDEDSAVEVALHNRLDLLTAAGRLDDAERGVRVAADGLRTDTDLTLTAGQGGTGTSFHRAAPDEWSATAGLVVGLPVNRQAERNRYREALIARDQAERQLELSRDGVESGVRNQLRNLRQLEDRIAIQTEQVAQERRAVAVTEIRYEAGDADNRDLLEARQGLVDAENSFIDLKAEHFIARLRLMRNLGILFIDSRGMWQT